MSSHALFCYDVAQSYGHVVARVCRHDETCAPCKQSCQKDVNLVEALDQTWSCFCGRVTLITFKFACKSSCSFGETLE